MEKTKGFLGWVVFLLLITLVIAVIPTEMDGAIYGDTLRLHILANSNSKEDQQLKLVIRDKLLEKYGRELSSARDIEDAEAMISTLGERVCRDVDGWIKDEGFNYSSNIVIGTEWYDTREYEDFTLPSGYYTSLRVMLGDAEGKNWWCVMYPPLCLDIATESQKDKIPGYTKAESTLISEGKYSVKFKILELISEAARQFGIGG